jgi:hypothetical protein
MIKKIGQINDWDTKKVNNWNKFECNTRICKNGKVTLSTNALYNDIF